jgi:hypothetical protein
MNQFLVATVLACLTREDLEALIQDLRSSPPAVKLERSWGSMTEGKLICLFSAADRPTLEQFLKLKHVHTEWIIAVETEWS